MRGSLSAAVSFLKALHQPYAADQTVDGLFSCRGLTTLDLQEEYNDGRSEGRDAGVRSAQDFRTCK